MKKSNSLFLTFKVIAVGLVTVIVVGLLLYIFNPIIKERFLTESNIKKKYADNVCLLSHDFAYAVHFPAEDGSINTIYLVKSENNEFDIWEADSIVNTANRVYATAFIIDSIGHCITSKYATMPWQNERDQNALKELFSKELNILPNDITVDGLSIRMAIQHVMQMNGIKTPEIICMPVKWTYDEYTETRFIIPRESNGSFPFRKLDLGETYLNNLEKGKPLYMLRFSKKDFSLGYPLDVSVKKLKLDHYEDYKTTFSEVNEWLPEGAPIFDLDQNLVGVYTRVNKQNSLYYVSSYLRSGSNDFQK
ncbi:hypothetical protein [Flavobacterium gawalongense]|uniref:Uncharacterized protein n=1 Tax=Flavobacterium gawalongense TaxID=2594432 RepID=A0ABY3CRM6_9FLAO|nr:hypothetical protein [Flavobacterium gawalongense]TRX03226.1 hypothetical protein FNW33_05190 [Flavobacterium gawalongense]TRX09888.1 hypothetical protein FNW12_01880 [Flavobacterium gawalongense]